MFAAKANWLSAAPDIISTSAPRKLQNIAKIAGKSTPGVKINKNDIKMFIAVCSIE
ncbi:hypothetical protein [Syntrophaceticus schinkii]|jgi:hypothetical protein|uniref:hypothetical protein n=1 Tax=Syntrophaceticus schinkii TaxID=499207 RepID=UPI0012EB78D2|nr:hypothetical protein [Syntrophaceticus schinkii]